MLEQRRARARSKWLFLCASLAVVLSSVGSAQATELLDGVPLHRLRMHSPDFAVEKIYRSMQGPSHTNDLRLLPPGSADIVWVRSVRTRLNVSGGDRPYRGVAAEQFLCHVNLDLVRPQTVTDGSAPSRTGNPRLLTLSQGQPSLTLPAGFGIPLVASEELQLTTQVLNLGLVEPPEGMTVRHEVEIAFQLQSQLDAAGVSLVPLFATQAYGLVLLDGDDGYYGISTPDEAVHGASCLPGETVEGVGYGFGDGLGREFTGHWVVPPGDQINRTNVTRLMALPFATTLHHAVAHLHPFARDLTLLDLGSRSELVRLRTQAPRSGRIGLAAVETASSIDGIPLSPDREYQLISRYRNSSGAEQDAMAVLLLFVRDLPFEQVLASKRR